jgi:hypothetical protein
MNDRGNREGSRYGGGGQGVDGFDDPTPVVHGLLVLKQAKQLIGRL